jgi:hypothetical protein
MMKLSLIKLDEPELTFGHNQKTRDPRDGLFLFGPYTRTKVSEINIGIIGSQEGIRRLKTWLKKIQKPVMSLDNDAARPLFPGFEAAFEVLINFSTIKTIEIDPDQVCHFLSYTDSHQRVYKLVNLYVDELIRHEKEEEAPVHAWFVVIPDEIYALCRPRSSVKITEDTIDIGIRGSYGRTQPQLFEIDRELQEAYRFEKHFHNQLKARLLKKQIITQIVKESTIAYHEILNKKGKPKRDLSKFDSAIAWNIATALYYKVGGVPWKLARVREGVCYVGLVYKRVETDPDEKTACCAAQMFLDSGDGMVFRGNIGPWYNPDTNQFHLTKESAFQLLDKALMTYESKNGRYPKELFIHAKTYFNDEEWNGFVEASNGRSKISGIRIRDDRVFKLYRDHTYPILRGMMYRIDSRTAFLWTRGFIPRIQTVLGLETPNPLYIEACMGDTEIQTVCEDILSLKKTQL